MITATHNGHVELPASVVSALSGRLGERAQQWIARDLPQIVQSCRSTWNLDIVEALSGGATAAVLSVRRNNRPCILKLHPDPDLFDVEIRGWRLWAGRCMPDLIASDTELKALLQERVEPGRNLVSMPEQNTAASAAAEVLADLHATVAPPDFTSLAERIFRWLQRTERLAAQGTIVTPNMVRQARQVAQALLDDCAQDSSLHGDFYPDNVLWSDRHCRWLAIDPEPCRGDPAFDAATWSYAYGRGTHLEANIEVFATRLHLPGERMQGWAFVVAVTNLALRTAYGHAGTQEITSGLAAIGRMLSQVRPAIG